MRISRISSLTLVNSSQRAVATTLTIQFTVHGKQDERKRERERNLILVSTIGLDPAGLVNPTSQS